MKHLFSFANRPARCRPSTGFPNPLKRRVPLICAASIALFAAAVEQAKAGVLYWDDNGVTTGTTATPNGTWGVDNFWNATQAGTGGGGVWYQGSDAVIAASNTATGSYTVTVSGAQSANSLGINRGTPTLAGTSSPSLTLGAGGLYVAQGSSSAGVGGAVTLASSLGTITLGASQNWANNITSAALHELFVNAGVQGSGLGTTTLNLTSLAAANFTNNLGIIVFNGVLSDGTGGGRLALNVNGVGNSGTTLAGANTFTGGVTLNSGTLRLLATTGSLHSGNALTFTDLATFNYDNTGTIAALSQSLATLSFTRGEGTVLSTRVAAQTMTLTFGAHSESAGATANFFAIGGINGTDNKIVLTGQAAGFLNQRAFFGTAAGIANNYAYYDAGGFVRGINYGVDANTSLLAGGTDIVSAGGTAGQYVRTTGAITAQTDIAINTLNITGPSNFTLDVPATLTLTNGGLLKSGSSAATFSGGVGLTTGGATELVIRADQAADNLTIATPILASSTGGVTKAGAGTASLASGGVNAYTGATTINAGTFSLLGADVIPNGSAVNIRGGNLNQNNSVSGGVLALGANSDTVGAVQLQGGGITGSTGVLTGTSYDVRSGLITGILGGAGVPLTKNGVGTVLIASASGPQQYTGATTVNGGILQITFTATQLSNTISSSSPLVLGGGVLNPISNIGSQTQFQAFAGTTPNQGDSTVAPGRSGASSTVRADLGAISRVAGGTLNLISGTNVGFTTTNANTASGILGNGITFNGNEWSRNTTIAGGATYTNAFAANTQNTDMTASITAALDATTGSVRFNTFAANTLTLTGNNIIESGGILVSNGTISSVSTIAGGTSLTSGNGKDLIVINSNFTGPLVIASNLVNNGPTPIGLTKAGQGPLTVSGTNTFTGGVFLNNGTLTLGSAGGLGTGNDLSFGGSSGTGSFGSYNLSTPILQLGGNSVAIATLSTDNANVGLPVIENASATAATLTATSSASKTYAGLLRDGTGGGPLGLTKGGSGTLTLASENTHSGDTAITGGTLALGHPLALSRSTLDYSNQGGALSFGTLTAATLGGLKGAQNLALTNTSAAAVALTAGGNNAGTTYSGQLSGTGSTVTKVGNGALTLTGASTYTGGTTIAAGTLKAHNVTGSATGTGAVLVGSGATLGGTGTVSGAVTVASGGILAAGNSVGTLSLGALTLSSGSVLKYEFNAGPANDRVNVSDLNGLTINGGNFFLFAENTTSKWLTAGTYHLFQFSGAIGGAGVGAFTSGSILNPQAGLTYAFGTSGSFVDLTISGLPTLTTSWTAPGGGTWGSVGNWSNGIPNFAGTTANLLASIAAPSTITLDGSKTVGTLEFDNALAYTVAQGTGGALVIDNGGTAALVKLTTGSHAISAPVSLLSATSVEVDGPLATLAVSGTVSGATALSKTGAGTLALSGANAAFTGNTTLSAGTLEVGHTQALGTGSLTVAANGATLRAGAASLAPANSVIIGSAVTATVGTQTNTFKLAGVVSDTSANGALTKTGNGTLILASDATYAGLTTISAGALQLGDGAASGSVAGAILNNGALVLNRADFLLALNSSISGTGTLTQAGPGTSTLNAVNSFTGDTVVSGGTLVLGSALALQTSRLNYNNQGGSLSFGMQAAVTLGGLVGAQNLALGNDLTIAVNLTVANGLANTYSGALSDGAAFGAALTKTGVGTLTLTGASSYTGTTTVNAGTLALSTGGVINGGSVQINAGGTLTVNGGALTASGTSNVANNAGAVTFNISSGSATFNAGLNASGNANQNWLINATGGTLTAASMTLGRSALVNATEPAAGATATGLYINGAAVSVTGNLNMGTATASNSAVSTRIDSGSLTVGGTTTIGLNNGGRWSVLDVNGGTFTSTDTLNGVFIGGPLVGNADLLIRAGTATVELIKLGQAGSGTSVINLTGGVLYVGSGGIVQNSAVLSVIKLAGGVLGAKADWVSTVDMQIGTAAVQAADALNVPHNITLGGALTGAGVLTKTGAGVLTLNGVNTYTGVTLINAGTLNANSDPALGDPGNGVTLQNGAVLQAGGPLTTAVRTLSFGPGGGTIDTNGHAVTLAAGTTVTGTAVTKTGLGALTLAGTQTYATLNADGGTTNVNSALGTGSSTLNANATVNINASQTLGALNIAGGVTVTFGDGLPFAGAPDKVVSLGGGVAVVPEPGAAGLLLVGAVGLLARRRGARRPAGWKEG